MLIGSNLIRLCAFELKWLTVSGRNADQGRATMTRLTINGKPYDVEVEADTPLLWVIRENVGLTGTKYGCGIEECGACTVHIDGVATRSCKVLVGTVGSKQIARPVLVKPLCQLVL